MTLPKYNSPEFVALAIPTARSVANETATYYSAFWLGIDGFGSSTVEQVN